MVLIGFVGRGRASVVGEAASPLASCFVVIVVVVVGEGYLWWSINQVKSKLVGAARVQPSNRHRDRSLGWCGRMRREGGKVWEGQQSVVGRAMRGKRGASRAVWDGLLLLPLCCSRARPIKSQAQGPRARQPEQVRSLSCRQIIGVIIFINSSRAAAAVPQASRCWLRLEYLLLSPRRRPRNFPANPPHRPAPTHRVGKVFHGLQGPRNKAPAAAARERRRTEETRGYACAVRVEGVAHVKCTRLKPGIAFTIHAPLLFFSSAVRSSRPGLREKSRERRRKRRASALRDSV